jgi:hypothetical protein
MLGYEIDFVSSPVQHSMPPDCIMSREMHLICDSEVKALLDKGAIREVSVNVTDGFISSMFAIHKKTGGWRPIINLKNLNSFIRYKHFKMEGIDIVKYLLQKNDWMVKIDLQDAYFLVPVSPRFFKFLRFFWNGSLFEYLCLPFGLCSAPRVFTKLLKPVVSFLRERGIRLIVYLDDILILNQSLSGILKDLEEVINLLEFLGFIINYKKSVVVPQQITNFGILDKSLTRTNFHSLCLMGKLIRLLNSVLTPWRLIGLVVSAFATLLRSWETFPGPFPRCPSPKVIFGSFNLFIFLTPPGI